MKPTEKQLVLGQKVRREVQKLLRAKKVKFSTYLYFRYEHGFKIIVEAIAPELKYSEVLNLWEEASTDIQGNRLQGGKLTKRESRQVYILMNNELREWKK